MTFSILYRPRRAAALAALLLASCAAARAEPDIAVEQAWARPAAAGGAAAAYFTIVNSGGPDRLLGVAATAAEASIHSTTMEGGVMRMRPIEGLDIPAASTVRLEPGGTHVMVSGLARPLEAGSSLALDLNFERSGGRRVELEVRPASAGGAAG